MRPRILFVDDDARIQQGLARSLRCMRQDWDMLFAEGSEAAMATLEQAPCDVVVSDMRMAGMDGADLLKWVRQRSPDAVRIILSGYSDKEAVFRTLGPAHQYLAKPCDHQILIQTIGRTLELRRHIASDKVRALVAAVDTLPTPPAHFAELVHELDAPGSSAASVAAVMARDVAMVAQTLKLTNSAYFGLPVKVQSLTQAVRLLGLETIRNLVLLGGFFRHRGGNAETSQRLSLLIRRSLGIGELAAAIARLEGLDDRTVAHAEAAGVLAHVGSLVLMDRWPERVRAAGRLMERDSIGASEAEIQVFGASHADVGAYLLGLWGFTDPIVEAVAYHHSPGRYGGDNVGPVAIVHVSEFLSGQPEAGGNGQDIPASVLDRDYLDRVGILDRLPVWAALKQTMPGENA
ncbi:MAG: HDOD domain-containing protein [Rhodospirillales bacterium]|nr:MAG: HDOD domain-containing protein [Rhodospirillales bacterium]